MYTEAGARESLAVWLAECESCQMSEERRRALALERGWVTRERKREESSRHRRHFDYDATTTTTTTSPAYVVKSTMLLASRLLSDYPRRIARVRARAFVWDGLRNCRLSLSLFLSRTPISLSHPPDCLRKGRSLGVETITPYTCSGLMVREYYIRIRNTPDNKGGECAVVV